MKKIITPGVREEYETLCDATGKPALTVANEQMDEGFHMLTIETKQLASGSYEYVLQAGDAVLRRYVVAATMGYDRAGACAGDHGTWIGGHRDRARSARGSDVQWQSGPTARRAPHQVRSGERGLLVDADLTLPTPCMDGVCSFSLDSADTRLGQHAGGDDRDGLAVGQRRCLADRRQPEPRGHGTVAWRTVRRMRLMVEE